MNLTEMSVEKLLELYAWCYPHIVGFDEAASKADSIIKELERRMRPAEGCVRLSDGRDVFCNWPLPVTANGELIRLVYDVYHPSEPTVPMEAESDGVDWFASRETHEEDGSVTIHTYLLSDCYSTREAAEAARRNP